MKQNKIEIVDLKNHENSIENIKSAFSLGSFLLKNAPIDLNNLKKVRSQLDSFYKLELENKLLFSQKNNDGSARGYLPIGSESGDANNVEKKESYAFGWPDELIPESLLNGLSLAAKNNFPDSEILNPKAVYRLMIEFADTAKQLIGIIDKSLAAQDIEVPKGQSSDYQSLLRSFRYHKTKGSDPSNISSNSTHTDWNLLTIVWTNAPGFQVELEDGSFADVNPEHESYFIVNFGDYLSSLTAGKIASPWHRVVDHGFADTRDSFVFFYYPPAECKAVKDLIYNNNKPLSLFVDQSKPNAPIWNTDKLDTMNQMYEEKWKQVSS